MLVLEGRVPPQNPLGVKSEPNSIHLHGPNRLEAV